MFDWIKKLFGSGMIYCDAICSDGSIYSTRAPYVGSIKTFDKDEHLKAVNREMRFKYGKEVVKIENIEFVKS